MIVRVLVRWSYFDSALSVANQQFFPKTIHWVSFRNYLKWVENAGFSQLNRNTLTYFSGWKKKMKDIRNISRATF